MLDFVMAFPGTAVRLGLTRHAHQRYQQLVQRRPPVFGQQPSLDALVHPRYGRPRPHPLQPLDRHAGAGAYSGRQAHKFGVRSPVQVACARSGAAEAVPKERVVVVQLVQHQYPAADLVQQAPDGAFPVRRPFMQAARHAQTTAKGCGRDAGCGCDGIALPAKALARCPGGKESTGWTDNAKHRGPGSMIHVQFRAPDCRACASRVRCTWARSKYQGRVLALLPRPEHEALAAARAHEGTVDGKRLYAQRNGVEGTLSQAVRGFGLRRARYRGLPKTGLQHVATAAALNLDRIAAWFAGRPLAPTRVATG